MLDGLTLDQLRTFIAAAEEGSFSAAGRKLGRAQSVVSQTLANLEAQLGVKLFDRSARYPRLTDEGRALLLDARAVADGMADFKAHAGTLREGLEPEVAAVIDVMYPMAALTRALGLFRANYPRTTLRLYVEVLGAVIEAVLERRCRIGVVGSLPLIPPEAQSQALLEVPFVPVVAPAHALAAIRGVVRNTQLAQQVQLVLTDRTSLSKGREFSVLSPQTWRLSDLGSKHAFLKAGFGWGYMPLPAVAEDIRDGRLVKLRIEGKPARAQVMPMHAVWRKDAPPGPAGRALVEWLTA
ncbi:MAG TPA: LysR family transcriptional regulator [Burkholderiales bacterium]|nr:LysR family transcriptional regulator [Burkholderiales bacterium]